MNGTTYRRAPGPLPDLPRDDVRQVRAEDDAELETLAAHVLGGHHGAEEITAWRIWGVPAAGFVAVTDRIVAVSLVHSHKGKFYISYLHTGPEWTVSDLDTAVVSASLRALDAPAQAFTADGSSTAPLLTGLGFTSEPVDLPVLVVDGAEFSDFAGFAREFTHLLDGYTWTGNLDAFNDILRGGFAPTSAGSSAGSTPSGPAPRSATRRWPGGWKASCGPATRTTASTSRPGSATPGAARARPCSTSSSRSSGTTAQAVRKARTTSFPNCAERRRGALDLARREQVEQRTAQQREFPSALSESFGRLTHADRL